MRMQMRLRASGACTIRIRKHLSSTKNIVPLSIIEPSSSLPDLHRNNPKTFKDLLGIVKKNSANREPCNIPLRRIEAKRRSLLHENETLTMHLDKLIANTTLKIENLEKYGLKGLEEDTEAKKMDFMETAVLGSKEKSGPKQEGFEIMYQELYEELTKPNLTDRKYDKFWKDIKKIKKNMPREGHSERRDKEPQSFAKVRTCLNGATLSMRTLDNLNKYFIKNNPESLKKGISKKKRKRKQSEANFAGYLEEPSVGLGHDRIINKRGSIDTTIYSKKSYSSQSQYPKLPSVRKEKKKDLKMTQLLTKESIKEDIIPKFG